MPEWAQQIFRNDFVWLACREKYRPLDRSLIIIDCSKREVLICSRKRVFALGQKQLGLI